MKKKQLYTGLSLSLLPFTLASAQNEPKQQDRPNIIYILADDLGYGDLGCYGQSVIKTPNLDKMAAQGMLFSQHYAGCTVSAPSRSSLMTGEHTGHTYIRGNKEYKGGDGEGQEPLPASSLTIAKMLKNAGYTTGAFGKWGLGYPGSEGDPNKQGFDEFYGYNCQRIAHNYYPYHLWHNQEKIVLEGNQGTGKNDYAQDLIHQKALQFIRDNKNKPFFAFLPYVLPHAELVSPNDSILKMYSGYIIPGKVFKGKDSPEDSAYKNGAYGSSQDPHADFAAMITRLDAYVGDVLKELEVLGLDKNTIVMFTSDNGPHREGGADPDFFKSYGPLRGTKRDMFEGGIRVPLIVKYPGKVPAGVKSDFVSAFWDMMPTFAELAKTKAPKEIDGISILPTLMGKKGQKQHEYLYWEFHEQGGKIAVRYGNWKGIKLQYRKNPNAAMKLYDLSKDIHEDNDLAAQNQKVVAKIEKFIKQARTESELFKF